MYRMNCFCLCFCNGYPGALDRTDESRDMAGSPYGSRVQVPAHNAVRGSDSGQDLNRPLRREQPLNENF